MKAYDTKPCRLTGAKQLAADVYDFTLQCPELAVKAVPGQFAQVRLPGHTLRRPISICGIDKAAGTLRLVFQIRGEGTAELAAFRPGDEIEILAPLGNGFPVEPGKKTLLVGGGIGVPPLLGAAAELGADAAAVLGFRNSGAMILEEDFKTAGAKVSIATDDGSYGFHGLVTELAEEEEFETVFACGPLPMLKAVKDLAQRRNVPCWLSLEERMACGVGACLGCAVALLSEQSHGNLPSGQAPAGSAGPGAQPLPDGWYYGHVCSDGPVFDSRKVIL